MLYLDAEDVALEPGPLVEDIFDADAEIGQDSGEFGDATGTVGDGDGEFDQTAVDGQTALQAAAQDRRVDVATAQWHHHSFAFQFG